MTIVTTFEVPEKKSNKKYLLILVPYFLILIITTVWVNNAMVGYGEKFHTLSKLEKSLYTENKVLEIEISRNKAIHKIASQSAKLGLTRPKNIEYVY